MGFDMVLTGLLSNHPNVRRLSIYARSASPSMRERRVIRFIMPYDNASCKAPGRDLILSFLGGSLRISAASALK